MAFLFGAAFILQGAVFLLLGGIFNMLDFRFLSWRRDLVPGFMLVYSMVIYPLIGLAAGHNYPLSPLFGTAPCPTVIFTFAIVLLNRNRVPRFFMAIPLLWSIVALGAAVNLGIPQDFGLTLSGILGALLIGIKNRSYGRRVKETNNGIQEEFTVDEYDSMQRRFRDRGILETSAIIKNGIDSGLALELGQGPGYLGLEWLKNTKSTRLLACDISPAMIDRAVKNCAEYGMTDRTQYLQGNVMELPVENNAVDGAFSNGSLHEWEHPEIVLKEVFRVLKPGGKFFLSDLRRDLSPWFLGIMKCLTVGESMKNGLMTSIQAAYRKKELEEIFRNSPFDQFRIKQSPFGLEVLAVKL
jgi:ubiquinone/menaquinone biosynthesis C-methylase UbiE